MTRKYGPVGDIMVLIISHKNQSLEARLQLSSGSCSLNFGLSLHSLPYLVYVSSKGSDETAHMCSLV